MEMFYGSLDRHNREFTPKEVNEIIKGAGFKDITLYGINCHSNWRSGTQEFVYNNFEKYRDGHPILYNTIVALAYQ